MRAYKGAAAAGLKAIEVSVSATSKTACWSATTI